MKIPEITIGSEKQIAWAKKIVAEYAEDFARMSWKPEMKPVVAKVFEEMFFYSNDAKHYINLRQKYGYGLIAIMDNNKAEILAAIKAAR